MYLIWLGFSCFFLGFFLHRLACAAYDKIEISECNGRPLCDFSGDELKKEKTLTLWQLQSVLPLKETEEKLEVLRGINRELSIRASQEREG